MPMVWLSSFSSALAMVGLAELGDKSQLMCMALALHSAARPILLGAFLAYGLLNLLAVVVGAALGDALPHAAIAGAAALIFTVTGIWTLRDAAAASEEEAEAAMPAASTATVLSAAGVLFVAELGDRTQIAVATLSAAAQGGGASGVWLGATVGMLLHAALGVWLGRRLLQRLPLRSLRLAAAGLFFLFAILALRRAVAGISLASLPFLG